MPEPEKNIEGLEENQGAVQAPSLLYNTKEGPTEDTPADDLPDDEIAADESPVETAEAEEPEAKAEGELTEGDKPEDTSEGENISSLQELVDHYEFDWEWFKGLKLPVKIDNETSEVTFSELVKSFKNAGAADNLLKEAKATKQAHNQELAKQAETLESQFAVASKLIQSAEALIDSDTQSIDWARLREDDPAEYSARKAELAERRQSIDQMKAEAEKEFQQASFEQMEQQSKELAEYVEDQYKKLLDVLPEWKDEEVSAKEKQELAKFLQSIGFSEDEIAKAYDHRLVMMARKAMLYDEGQSKVAVAKKKVRKAPKTMKSGPKTEKKKPRPTDAATILYGQN